MSDQELIDSLRTQLGELQRSHEQTLRDIMDIVTGHGHVPPTLGRVEEFLRAALHLTTIKHEIRQRADGDGYTLLRNGVAIAGGSFKNCIEAQQMDEQAIAALPPQPAPKKT